MGTDTAELSVQARIARVEEEISGVVSLSNVRSADVQFMRSVRERGQTYLTDKQDKWLRDIENRVFEEDDNG